LKGESVTFTKLTGPAWLSVSPDGLLKGTPTMSELGLNSLEVQAANGAGLTDMATIRVNVVSAR